MGTNFYIRKRLNSREKRQLFEYIRVNDFDKLVNSLPEKIHLGKRSCGWKFLWDANNFKYFKPTKESFESFLRSGIIIDEYGEVFDYDKFMYDELDGFLDKGYDSESYDNDHPELVSKDLDYWKTYHRDDIQEFIKKHGVNVNDSGEFYIDIYRFSIFTDFS